MKFLLFSILLSSFAHAQPYPDLAHALQAIGYNKAVCVSNGAHVPIFGIWDITQTDPAKRYVFPADPGCAGEEVGERFSPVTVVLVVRHPSNPLNIQDNQNWSNGVVGGVCSGTNQCVSFQDRNDVVYAGMQGAVNANSFDNYFIPTYNRLYPASPSPSPSAAPSPSPSPVAGTQCQTLSDWNRQTAEQAPTWLYIGPGRKNRLLGLRAWVESCDGSATTKSSKKP